MSRSEGAPPWGKRTIKKMRLLSKLQGFTHGRNGWNGRPCDNYYFRIWFAEILRTANVRMKKVLYRVYLEAYAAGFDVGHAAYIRRFGRPRRQTLARVA